MAITQLLFSKLVWVDWAMTQVWAVSAGVLWSLWLEEQWQCSINCGHWLNLLSAYDDGRFREKPDAELTGGEIVRKCKAQPMAAKSSVVFYDPKEVLKRNTWDLSIYNVLQMLLQSKMVTYWSLEDSHHCCWWEFNACPFKEIVSVKGYSG